MAAHSFLSGTAGDTLAPFHRAFMLSLVPFPPAVAAPAVPPFSVSSMSAPFPNAVDTLTVWATAPPPNTIATIVETTGVTYVSLHNIHRSPASDARYGSVSQSSAGRTGCAIDGAGQEVWNSTGRPYLPPVHR